MAAVSSPICRRSRSAASRRRRRTGATGPAGCPQALRWPARRRVTAPVSEPVRRESDPRSIAGKAPRPERHVAVVVVGGGAAGVAAAVEAAGAGVEVLLVDENPVDNDTMAMDVPLYFGQRMQPSVRNRALMLERVVESNPALASAYEAGVDVQLGTCVWGAFVNGPTVQELDAPLLGLADEWRSWLVGYDRLIVAAGARDVVLGFPGWERAGVMAANAAFSLLTRYRALAARRMVVVGSGSLGLRTAAFALEHGVDVAAIVEVAPRVRGDAELARSLERRGVAILTSHTIREARGRVGEVESVVVVRVDDAGMPAAGSDRELACDTVCLAVGLTPSVELLALAGARLRVASALGGWEANVCQCEEVTRRELVETRPPRYLAWQSPQMSARSLGTLLRDGPINQDQIKRLTRAGMGPCQSRRCREQVALLLAEATTTPVERIPLPTFRPPLRPLPLSVLWPGDEPPAMRGDWVSWFGIPTQFSPHWEAGMAMDEPTSLVGGLDMTPHTPPPLGSAPAKPGRSSSWVPPPPPPRPAT